MFSSHIIFSPSLSLSHTHIHTLSLLRLDLGTLFPRQVAVTNVKLEAQVKVDPFRMNISRMGLRKRFDLKELVVQVKKAASLPQ